MRTKTAEWFECKVQYEHIDANGMNKKVKELYAVDALSFSESEGRIIDEMSQYINGDYEVIDIKKAKYKEILFDERESADRWYKIKSQYITLDEKTEKEKRQNVINLVQSDTIAGAIKTFDEFMSGTMIDYTVVEVKETLILDVIEHKSKSDVEAV